MRKILVLFLCMFLVHIIYAQDTIKIGQEVKKPKVMVTGLGGLMSETSVLKKNLSESLGACGALMINNYFYVGAYGLTIISNHTIKDLVIPDEFVKDGRPLYYYGKALRINFSHAGFWVGGILFPEKMFHLGLSSRFGWGNIHLSDSINNSYINNVDYRLDYTNDKVFVISPQIELDIKITSWLKANIGFGYNFVTGIDFDRYKEFNFNAPRIVIGVFFGGFSNNDDDDQIQDTEFQDE